MSPCGAKKHFPENYPCLPFCDSSQHSKPPPVCHDFTNGQCTGNSCTFQHIYLSCKGPHPQISCPGRTDSRRATKTSDTRFVPRQSLTIKCYQVHDRPLLSSKHTLQPTCTPLLSIQLFHTCTPSTEAHHQIIDSRECIRDRKLQIFTRSVHTPAG